MTEKRDWFGLYYQNQNANYTDFLQNGIAPNDVVLNDKNTYKKNDKIIQAFTDNEGKFNEEAFDNFYNQALSSYNTFAQGNFKDTKLPELEYDIMSAIRRPQDKVQKIDFNINKKRNPFIETEGITTVLGTSESKLSPYEIAQSNLIWDTRTNSWMNKTPEDLGFWGTINETPIVFARYEEDIEEVDPNTGRKVRHFKGEMKLDENGSPYYETLGNRAAHNKEFLSPFNVLTKEGSAINKFDFLDNDGKEKSIGGTIAQTVATIAPMLIPYVGEVYTYGLITKNAAQLGITLYKMLDGVFNPEKKDYEYGLLNTIEGKLSSFSPGVSEYSKENMVTFENFGNLVSDMASQLFQQRLLAQIPYKLGFGSPEKAALKKTRELFGDEIADEILSTGKLSDNATLQALMGSVPDIAKVARTAATRNNLMGKWLSSFYMSGISTMDVFNDGLDAGYDRDAAAFTAALAMAATTWMIGSTEIGQKALKGLGFDEERIVYKSAGKKLIDELKDQVTEFVHSPIKDQAKFNLLLRKAGNIYKGAADVIARGGIVGNALAEGIEEMSEEAIMDTSKAFTDALTGVFGIQKEGHFDFLESNPLERYLMAGAGGAVGGAIFKVANRSSEINNKLPKDTKEHIFYLLRNGRKAELKQALEEARKKGVAPKELSIYDPEFIDGELQYKPSQGQGDSLNDAVIDLANTLIDQWDAIINQEALNLDEDAILNRLSLQDKRIKNLLEFEGVYQIAKDYNNLGTQIVELVKQNNELKEQISPGKGKEGINVEGAEAQIRQNEAKLLELRKQKDELLDGAKTEEYISKSLFYLSPFKNPVLSADINTYSKNVLGKDYNTLSQSEQEDVRDKYNKYKESFDKKFHEGYILFQEMTKKYGKELMSIAEQIPLLDGIKQYLSQAGENALLDLNEEALNQFNIDKQLNAEKGLPMSRGLEYIINHDNLTFADPNTQNIINAFFKNLSIKAGESNIPIGIDTTSLTSAKRKFLDFNNDFIDDIVMNTISKNEDGSLSPFGKLMEEIQTEVKENANNPESNIDSSDIVNERVLEYINSNVKNNEFKQLLINIVNSGYNDDPIQYLKNIQTGIRNIVYAYNHELAPQLKLASAKLLLANSKANGLELTKDLYQQLLTYIKPDSEFELNKKALDASFATLIDESLAGIVKIEDFTPERFAELNMPDAFDYSSKVLAQSGINDIQELIDTVNKLQSAKSWFDVARILNDSKLSEQGKLLLTNTLSDTNKKNTHTTFKELNVLSDYLLEESQLKSNPVLELLKKVNIDVLGSNDPINIFDLLENENAKLKSVARLSEFVIQGKIDADRLTGAIQTIDLLKSIISSSIRSTDINKSGYGYNTTINQFRQKNGVNEILPELDPTIATKTLWELNRISNQLNFFKKLSEMNVGNKLREHKLTAIKTRQALIKNFLDRTFTSKRPEVFEGTKEIIDSYDTEELFKSELSDDNFIALEELVTKVEDKIYDNINSLASTNKFTKQQIIEDLFKGYDFSELVKGEYNNPEALNENIRELKPSELFTYYHVLSTIKSSDYSKALKEVVDEEMSQQSGKLLIPIFSQEFASRINTAMAIDPEFMNNITIINSERLNSIKSQRSKQIYTNYIDSYKNLIFNNGAPGVGKTNGVGKLTHRIINKILGDQHVVLVGPKPQQAINLTNAILGTTFDSRSDINSINSETSKGNNLVQTKDQLLATIYKDPSILVSANSDFENNREKGDYIEFFDLKNENFQTCRLKPKYLDKSNFNNDVFKDQKIIYIDEITHFSKFELEALTTWANNNNKILLTFGDLLQSGYSRDNAYMGIDVDALKISTPTLSTSLRVSNIHKKDNLNLLRSLVSQVYSKDIKDRKQRFALVRQALKDSPALKYYEDRKILNGEKITESTSIEELEKLVNASKGDVGYIYDDPSSTTYGLISNFNKDHERKIRMFKLSEVQGLEAPYFITDLHFDFTKDASLEKNIKDLYTAITRSEEGTIIINNGLTNTLSNGSEKVDYTQQSILNNESARSFSELRLKSLNSLLQNYQSVEPKIEPKSKTITSDIKPSNITFEKIMDDVFNPDETESIKSTEKIYSEDSKVRDYPEDSFIAYSYDGRVKEFPIKDKDGNIISYSIKSDITSSGLYNSDHTGFFNGQYSKLSPAKFKKVDKAIQSMKSILYSFQSKQRRNEEFNKVESEVNNIFRDVTENTGTLDIKNGKFQLKAIKFFNDGEIHSDGSNRSQRLRVVYTIPILNSSTSQETIELSVYSLPNGLESKFEGRKWFESYKPFYANVMNQVESDLTKLYTEKYIPLADDFELEKITNLVIYKKDPEGRKHYNFEDRGTQFKGLYFSNPYVVVDYTTNKAKRNADLQNASDKIAEAQRSYLEIRDRYIATENLNEKKALGREMNNKLNKLIFESQRNNLKGKAIVFATYAEKIYDTEGNLVPESEYADYYVRQASGEFDNNPDLRDKMRMIVLSPNPLTFREFYNNYDKYIKSYSQSNGNKLGNKFYKSYFGDYTGFDIILSILNYKNWLESNDKINSKHYKIAERLYNGLVSLASASTPQLTNIKTKDATDFHIMRIMERLHQEFDSQLLDQYKSNAEKINGNDVLRYFREIINTKIKQEQGKYTSGIVENKANETFFMSLGSDISSENLFDFMESALIGRVGDKIVPNYNPIFKEGIYPFPVMEYDKDQKGHTGDRNFIRAMNLEGSYYIDRDLQTPQFAFVASRDLANPEEFGYKKLEIPRPQASQVSKTEVISEPTNLSNTPNELELRVEKIEKLTSSAVSEINKISNEEIKDILSTTLNEISVNAKSIPSAEIETYFKNSIQNKISEINSGLQTKSIPYDSTTDISYIKYVDGKISIYTKPKVTENIDENTRKLDENRVYLQNNFGGMFNHPDITVTDLNTLVDNFKLIEANSDGQMDVIKNFIKTGKYSPELFNLLSNENIKLSLVDINKIRSKYNIC